eukprot:TRINITY_DN45817_c0_g1_i1.p1 TRINITY_DN45817_c0_g1~~TRINITY_DN45817_c0_g1_i1.p1  ORF type:complete len:1163 (+),score=141.41 TRINITY_DN45817_c0_g1_i1:173-3661(+)
MIHPGWLCFRSVATSSAGGIGRSATSRTSPHLGGASFCTTGIRAKEAAFHRAFDDAEDELYTSRTSDISQGQYEAESPVVDVSVSTSTRSFSDASTLTQRRRADHAPRRQAAKGIVKESSQGDVSAILSESAGDAMGIIGTSSEVVSVSSAHSAGRSSFPPDPLQPVPEPTLIRSGFVAIQEGKDDGESSGAHGSQHMSYEDRLMVAAERRVTHMRENADLLTMRPERLAVQQDLLSAKGASRLLALCSESEVAEMDTVNLATAVHRIAKVSVANELTSVVACDRFAGLLNALSVRLHELSPQGLVNVFWALVQLEASPDWLPELISLIQKRSNDFTVRDLSTVLSCLAKTPFLHALAEAESLKTAALEMARERVAEFITPTDLVCLAAALSRLELRDEQIFARIADHSLKVLHLFDTSDIASLLWAFASVHLVHKELLEGIKGFVEQQIERCSPKEIVQLAWGFSRVRKADKDLFVGVFAPAIRAKMLELDVPRGLCTVAWTFSNASVTDTALFNDLAYVLSANVKSMNAHDVSSVVVAFASIEYAHRRLFKDLQKQARSLIHSFSPLQLARTIYGFGVAGVEDETLFRLLCEQVLKLQHSLHAKNVVEIIVGLSEAEYTPPKVIGALLRDTEKLVRYLGAEDAIQLLHALGRLPSERRFAGIKSGAAPGALLDAVRRRGRGWWRFGARDAADLFEALQALNLQDSMLLETACRQLSRIFQSAECTQSEFLRVLGALAEFHAVDRCVVREHLHRGAVLRASLELRLADTVAGMVFASARPDYRTAALLTYACARLGYDGPAVSELIHAFGNSIRLSEAQHASEPWWPLLLWVLAELGMETDLAHDCLHNFLTKRYGEGACHDLPSSQNTTRKAESEQSQVSGGETCDGDISAGALLHIAWSCSVLNVNVPQALLEEISIKVRHQVHLGLGRDHVDLARVVAAEVSLRTSEALGPGQAFADANDGAMTSLLASAPISEPVLAPAASAWLGTVVRTLESREATKTGAERSARAGPSESRRSRTRLDQDAAVSGGFAGLAARNNEHEQWLSDALVRLRVPHETSLVVAGIHRIAAFLPQEGLMLEVVGPSDMTAPSERPLGSSVLRRRQLAAFGFARHEEFRLHTLRRAKQDGSLEDVLASALMAYGLRLPADVTQRLAAPRGH